MVQKNNWLTFKFKLPITYKPFEEAYPFNELLIACITTLDKCKVSPNMVKEKYGCHFKYPNKDLTFDVEIKIRSAPQYKKWLDVKEFVYSFIMMLEALDHPDIVKEKLKRGIVEEFSK